ncbi:hypothetical protein T484DRAFT_1815164 [Baffinella frigidus]|nr:hypothetical protein T484DRAFT_1815164 [Cryptophyta sp. CCMP2293]
MTADPNLAGFDLTTPRSSGAMHSAHAPAPVAASLAWGNAQKSAVARARNLALAQKNAGGNSQLADKGKAMTIKCKICMQPFM